MNILYVLSSFSTDGGTAAKVLALVNASRCKSFVIAPNLAKDDNFMLDWKQTNAHIIRYDSSYSFWKKVNFVKSLVAEYEIHVIHAFFPEGMYVAVMSKMIYPHIKVVRSLEGAAKRKWYIRIASRLAFYRCDHVIYISQYVKKYYKQYVKLAPNSVIYNSAYNIVQNNADSSGNGVCRILCVCGLNESKNIPMFPEIAKKLAQKDFSFHVTICGDGSLREWLVKKIKKYNLDNYFSLPGRVLRPQEYFSATDIYIHPADLEGFGLAVVEAMSAGLPIIVSDKGALPELIEHQFSGLVLPAYDSDKWAQAIMNLYESPHIMKRLGECAKSEFLKRFTPDIYAHSMDSMYEALYVNPLN